MNKLIYVATPYSHEDPAIREKRYLAVTRLALHLIQQGHHIYSPITCNHPIALMGDLPKSWDYWKTYDEVMLSLCYKIVVLKIDGWEQSTGVKAEIEIARGLGLEIEYVEGDNYV